jgi:hypothetical protein
MSAQPGKDTIYIDIDDEITTIIDRVRGSHEKIVALVLPKRATVLQSIVNMKLLKRTADEAKKHLVLITSEAGLLPLAGSVGIYVAKSLQSKPEVPAGLASNQDSIEDQEEAVNMADDLDSSAPVAEHMRRAPSSVAGPSSTTLDTAEDDAPIELDNTSSAPAASSPAKKAKKGAPKFRIPDFNKFRIWGVIGGVAVVVLIFMLYMGFVVMPRANISVKTDSSAIQESLDLQLSTAAKAVDVEDNTVPAQTQESVKTLSQQADATGQVDKGAKATGTVTIINCGLSSFTLPAGSGMSANGLTFITRTSVTVPISNYTPTFKCKNDGKVDVAVVAQGSGANYNIPAQSYSIPGSPDKVSAQGSAMEGGTSQLVKVVSQADIDGLKQKIATQDSTAVKKELQQALTGKGLYPIDGSFANADPEITTNVKAGDEAPAVTMTQKITYTMMGVKQDDLKKVIANAVNKKIDKNKQQILDYGLDEAVFKLQNQQRTSTLVSMDITAIAGTDINIDDITKQIAGKKSHDAKEIISGYPGVTDVTVDYSPFWVSSIPKKASKITITVEKPVIKNANQ